MKMKIKITLLFLILITMLPGCLSLPNQFGTLSNNQTAQGETTAQTAEPTVTPPVAHNDDGSAPQHNVDLGIPTELGDDVLLLDSIPELGVSLYCTGTKGWNHDALILCYADKIQRFDYSYMSKYTTPKIVVRDLDSDRQKELFFVLPYDGGTGIAIDRIVVFDPELDGSYSGHLFGWDEMNTLTDKACKAEKCDNNIMLVYTYVGKTKVTSLELCDFNGMLNHLVFDIGEQITFSMSVQFVEVEPGIYRNMSNPAWFWDNTLPTVLISHGKFSGSIGYDGKEFYLIDFQVCPPTGSTNGTIFTGDEIGAILSELEDPPSISEGKNEYLPEFKTMTVNVGEGHFAYGYSVHEVAKDGINIAEPIMNVDDGELLTVIAYNAANDRYCVIVNSTQKACWINADYIS